MHAYGLYFLKRLGLFLAVVVAGITAAFFITHMTPLDPVEQTITTLSAYGQTSPAAVAEMRRVLNELYGTDQPLMAQYLNYWRRLVTGDLGPSLSSYPTPVFSLIARAIPWTFGLLGTATVLSWIIGNYLGGLAGYYQNNRLLKTVGVVAMGLQPIPYYIVAFVVLVLFGSVWPILPISGGYARGLTPGWNLDFMLSVVAHSILPALSLLLVGLGTWFLGMRSLVSNIVTEDYVTYAELAGVDRRRIHGAYVMRNALLPQTTGLAMSLGTIFSGTVITEYVFSYPGLGRLLILGVTAGDYNLVLGVTSISIIGVALAVFIVDMLYPVLDPRVRLS
ncbi:MAG: ABC transporter permease [Alphaproteobacteria bacterium]